MVLVPVLVPAVWMLVKYVAVAVLLGVVVAVVVEWRLIAVMFRIWLLDSRCELAMCTSPIFQCVGVEI